MIRGLVGKGASVLAIGAHADDVEIGCAGTLLRVLDEVDSVSLHWIVLSAEGIRADEARASATKLAGEKLAELSVLDFRERYFPHLPKLKERFDALAAEATPDLVLCPWKGDAHQDHATTGRLVHETFRNALVLQYEIPKRDGDVGRPGIYVPLSEDLMQRKTDHLMELFPSQLARAWFETETFRGLAKLRGIEAGTAYAEAFHCDRLVL